MNIKAREPAPEIVEPTDTYDESMERSVEEIPLFSPPKERNKSDIVLVILAVFLLAFIVTMIVIFCVKGSTPDTLIQCVLGAGGLEALILAGIKVSKVITGSKSGTGPSDGVG